MNPFDLYSYTIATWHILLISPHHTRRNSCKSKTPSKWYFRQNK